MVDLIFTGLSKVLSYLLTPIDNILISYVPSLETIITSINNFLEYILNYIVWAISWLPIDYTFISIGLDILIAYFTILILLRPINLLLQWIKEVRT